MQQYLVGIWNQINVIVVGRPAKKDKFCKHIQKVIRKAEKYRKYLQDERQKSKDAFLYWDSLLNQHDLEEYVYINGDESPFFEYSLKHELQPFLYSVYDMDREWGHNVYFPDNECLDTFYMKYPPKPGPLDYLLSMILGIYEQEYEKYEGLELLDYQFTLLAIIHDAQSRQTGGERIYFKYNPLKRENLKERLCHAVWDRLTEYDNSYYFRGVQQTIQTAMLAVRAELDRESESAQTEAKNAEPDGKIKNVEHLEQPKKPKVPGTETTSKEGGEEVEEKQNKPTPAEERAWKSWLWVCGNYPDLVPSSGLPKNPTKKNGKPVRSKLYTPQEYEKALEESDQYQDDEGHLIFHPNFGSWKRNISGYMKKKPKESSQNQETIQEPRRGQIDKLTEMSNKYTPSAD